MPLQPSRKDVFAPPPDTANLGQMVRHHGSYLRSAARGYLDGRFATPSETRGAIGLVGGSEDGGGDGAPVYEWEWSDRFSVITPGAQSVILTHEPIEESLQVVWHPGGRGGLVLTNDQFIVNDQQVILPDPEVLVAGDGLSFHYQFDPNVEPDTPTFRDAAPQALNGFIFPEEAQVGDFLIAVAMMPSSESVTALNGWTLVGVSDYVTHGAIGGDRTYRLEVYSGVYDGVTVPTVSNIAPQDVVCSMAAFIGGGSCTAIFDTLADGTTAYAPELNPVALRIWGTIGNTVTITPQRGAVILSTNYVEIDTAMTIDPDSTPAPADTSGAAGWCLASVYVGG